MTTKKNSKLLLVGITLLLIVGIGSVWYVNYQKEVAEPMDEELRKEKLEAEKKLALYIVQNYEDVHKIHFRKLTQTKETDYWHVTADINDKYFLNFSMDFLSAANKPSVGYRPSEFKLIKSNDSSRSLANVEVIYSEGAK